MRHPVTGGVCGAWAGVAGYGEIGAVCGEVGARLRGGKAIAKREAGGRVGYDHRHSWGRRKELHQP